MLSSIDLTVIGIYAVVLLSVALYVSTRKTTADMSSEDYFLAGKSLPWWAIGASLIAANISAEQIIGQSGQGFVVGLAIAAYEWQAAIVLIIVAKYFLPIFLEKKIIILFQSLKYSWDSTLPVFGGASSDRCRGRVSYYILLITSLLSGYVVWISYNAALTSELMITEKTYPFKDLESVSSTNWRYDNSKECH